MLDIGGVQIPDPVAAGAAVTGLGALAWSLRTSYSGGAAVLLALGANEDPDARAAAGKDDNELLRQIALAITPSAWKKAYLAGNDENEAEKLDLPAWMGEEARDLVEPEAVVMAKIMQREPIDVPGVGPVETCFVSARPEKPLANVPPLVLIPGFDSSVLEFRYVLQTLLDAGLRVETMEWWTNGFTDRTPFLNAVNEGAKPWDLIREHQKAFVKRQLGDEKPIVLGASLGGAVALDFAATHPEMVSGLILMDAGGESYAQPDPFLTSLAANAVTNLFQWRANNGLLPYPHVWSKEENWRQALQGYLQSGGYQNRVGPELIRTVPQPTLVLWGEEDDVLPVEDAEKYRQDLPNCVGVSLIPNAQHAPALENPSVVAEELIRYAKSQAGSSPQLA